MALATEMMGGGMPAGMALAAGGGYQAVTAAGTSQATATLVKASMNMVAAADGTKAIRLPAAMPGDEIWVFNNSASTLPVYPPSGSAISVAGTGVGSADAAFSQLTYKSSLYKYFTATQIVVITTV